MGLALASRDQERHWLSDVVGACTLARPPGIQAIRIAGCTQRVERLLQMRAGESSRSRVRQKCVAATRHVKPAAYERSRTSGKRRGAPE
jgi:hypothetical protein